MKLKPGSQEKIRKLLHKGVDISNPATLDVGDEVNIDQISNTDVRIYPGCRIYGKKTVISAGSRLGQEGPVTIENCQLGLNVELKGGYFSRSVFLDKANMGMSAHVREGTILEEQANGAHCVGLKQTILFPFVTLGSLINFCDCLMAGGTSRQNHSEVGSSYIHFNYTPDADKTTPSLIGDVPRGVMLNQPPIFLGGQGGIIGPLRIGYGNVVAAGTILRQDYLENNKLILETAHSAGIKKFVPAAYPNIKRIVENNILYLANLKALEEWYMQVRKSFFAAQEFGSLIYDGAMDNLSLAKKERLQRLKAMAEKAMAPHIQKPKRESISKLYKHMEDIEGLFSENVRDNVTVQAREEFLENFTKANGNSTMPYIETIQKLPAEISAKGVKWLNCIVDCLCGRVSAVIPSLKIFRK